MLLKIKKNIKKILSLILILIGTCFSFIYVYKKYNIRIQEKNKIDVFLNNNNYDSINKIDSHIEQVSNNINDEYLFILEIPKINLKKGIYSYESKNNNVNKNIMILKQSDMPDVDKGNILLASHSGNSNVSHFKNLDNLKYNDILYIYYKGYKYMYRVNNVYKQEKKGYINVSREINKSTLTLITCDKTNKNYQLVFICYLDNIIAF